MKKIFRIYNEILNYIAVIGLIGFLGCVTLQVFARAFLPTSPNWTEELARFLFIFMVAFAGQTAVTKDEYVGVELLTERFSPFMQKVIKLIVLTMITAFSVIIFFLSVAGPKGLLAMTPANMRSTALMLPMKGVYVSLVILFGLYMLSYVMKVLSIIFDIDVYDKKKKEEE